MSVILGSEIARLVFGYLQEEQLDEAATAFCKTCPYLTEEYDWLQRGYRAYKISDLCLVDIIREHCEIKYATAEYIESLPLSLGETLKTQKSLSGKINSIFELLANSTDKPNSTSRKRPYSTVGSSCTTDATQSNELPGYEPPFKERRLSRKLILRQDATPKQNAIWTPTSKQQNAQGAYFSDEQDQDEENISPEQTASTEKSRNETSQYPIFTETILENTQFQSVLVDNINRILETSAERIDATVDGGAHDTTLNNNSLQEQVRHAIDNIIMSTEQDPTFQQVLDDVVQHTAIYEQSVRATSSTNDLVNGTNGNDKTDSPVPLKQRLRNRSQDKPRPNYAENDHSMKKKKKGKVEVISNEIVSGGIRDLLHPTTVRSTADSYVPLNQILYVNSDKSTSTFSGQDLVYVNVGSCVPSFSEFRIDADTPMYVQDISLANNGASTSLTPGSIINLPTMEQQIQPIQSILPNVIVKEIVEVSKTKEIERSIKTTPNASKSAMQVKVRSLTSPRRQSHVRSLNFTTSDESINENERPKSKLDESNKKLEPTGDHRMASTSSAANEPKVSNQKTSLAEVEPPQDSSDAVDFSKEFDEATVISVELSPATATKSKAIQEEKPVEISSEKKKPQTRRQSQKDLERWNQMRRMKKGEWDNYLRQTVASVKTGRSSGDRKRVKKRRSKIRSKTDEANVSVENEANKTTDVQARLLEEALKSAKKPASPVTRNDTPPEIEIETTNDTEPVKPSSSPVVSTLKADTKNPPSPSKRSSGGRKQLIQIKLPASAKKKPNVSVKRRSRSTTKRVVKLPAEGQKPKVETSRIDPSQTIDIDLISPIEHPKELSNPVKCGVNLNSFLETPCKESSSFKYPITPGLVISSSIKTPGVRLNKDYDSLIKFPEYPTPSFAITPGRTKTPMSQSSSQKDGSSYNRATDYSSGGSYYKPDESDDIDRNLDTLIKESVKENRNQIVESGLGIVPQSHIDSCNDQEEESNGELSDSSSSTSSSSQTSSTSTCSSPSSVSDDHRAQNQASEDAKRLLIAQRTQQQLRLEQVRLRTMATLKSDSKIERFRKPKTKISNLQRQKVKDGAGMMKKPVQTLKMTGNSTPKVLPKVLPKHVNKLNPKTITTTPSKRKIATPRRVIYLDYKDTIKPGLRVATTDRKSEQLQSQSNDNATVDTLKPVQNTNPVRPCTPTETIDAIENHIARTCQQNLFVKSPTKATNENQVDTPNLLQQLQDKSEVTDNASTPEGTSVKRAILVRELFGDATMSDSDFMDTPVKVANTSRDIVPIVVSTVAVKTDPKKAAPNLPKINDKATTVTNSIAANTQVEDTKSSSKVSDTKSDDSQAGDTKVKESRIINSAITDSKVPESNVAYSNSEESKSVDTFATYSKESQVQDSPEALEIEPEAVENKVLIADDGTLTPAKPDHTQAIASDSPSESDDDDDYDDCICIPSSLISNGSNRIYHNVMSDSKECAIKPNTERLDLRPMTISLGDDKIVIRTCEEIVLFSATPKAFSPQTSTSKTVPKKRIQAKAVEAVQQNTTHKSGVRKTEVRYKKVQKPNCDGADSLALEKNARFNIIAKHKGPVDASSAHTSSSRDQRKIVQPSDETQPTAGTSHEIKKSSQQHPKIPPQFEDIDINKVLGKIHPSKEIA